MINTQQTLGFIKWRRIKRETIGILVFGIILFAGYLWFLNHQENRAEKYFANLQKTAPERYLHEIKGVAGYEFFLREFSRLKGYDRFRSKAPEFLLGRWSVVGTAKRVSDSFVAPECANPFLIENGRITLPGSAKPIDGARYKLVDSTLIVNVPDGENIVVSLVSTGILLHHFELKLPGQTGTSFGYTCK